MTRCGIRLLMSSLVLATLVAALPAVAQDPEGLPRIAAKTRGLERMDGLLTVWLDRDRGKVWLQLPAPDADGSITQLLYVDGLSRGLGSNPVGLDRGKVGSSVVLDLRRVGGKVLFEQPNLGFRAISPDARERKAVEQSFASSVLWGADVAAQNDDGSTLIELTSFLVRDAHGVARTLQQTGQGNYRLEKSLSTVDPSAVHAFPENLEFDAILTFTGSEPGRHVRSVAPTAESVSLVQHHSLVKLPEAGYRLREFDPRAGSFAISFQDYAVPIDAPLTRRWIVRHRLDKTDPTKKRSRVKKPIVYHVDPGTPEPIRQALIDGASWWADAFDAAGFIDAYRVEVLPEGAHPLDVRYNMIHWVHRSTRGWSYGGGVVDPRTGERIKGNVSLGSLRVRQDRLLFEGLLGTAKTGSGEADDPVQLALARIRQLSAHEVGHTLGITHNFAASTYGRASVMDYPAPLVRLDGDRLDVSEAYGVGVGAWDRHAIRWAYSEFSPNADEPAELDKIIQEGIEAGLLFLTDQDARPAGAAHPLANLWDNGEEPVAELERLLELRRHAIDRFGAHNVSPGKPLALLEEVFATVYFHHRYQVDAAVKVIGGVDYRHALAGDGQPAMRTFPSADQLRALNALVSILRPENLDIPEDVLRQIHPRPFGYGSNRELFDGATDPLFDPAAAAATAADQVVSALLQPQRCARLVDQKRRDGGGLGLDPVLETLLRVAFRETDDLPRALGLRRIVQQVVVDGMLELLDDPVAPSTVRSKVRGHLSSFTKGDPRDVHIKYLQARVNAALERPLPGAEHGLDAPPPPPGSPIGAEHGCGWDDQLRP